jgi:hypothetical protein
MVIDNKARGIFRHGYYPTFDLFEHPFFAGN